MGREIRKVPKNWTHPKTDRGELIPLHPAHYLGEDEEWDSNLYMPQWDESESTHIQMYETCSEGTPISPVMETPEELARWLADNEASSFGSLTASYEQWLETCKRGWAPSAILSSKGLQSGVEALSEDIVED